ncbi:hypothetical protein FQN54_006268 [Arachnomyces sp. PD_36]|nr:hypothetical protein FQN54_006268 [Arachnomyces sp. PD_36]
MATAQAGGTGFASRVEGLFSKTMKKDVSSDNNPGFNNPFGASEERRTSADENAIEKQRSNDSSLDDVAGSPPEGLSPDSKSRDRSMSKEWGT